MNPVTSPPLPGTVPDPRYPDEDGRFMGDTDFHNVAMGDLRFTLVEQLSKGLSHRAGDRLDNWRPGADRSALA
jgi:hypothetical protein